MRVLLLRRRYMRISVFDTAGSVGGQLDAPIRIEGVDGLDKADGADGDQILHAHAGVVKALGNVDHQPEVVLDEQRLGFLIPLCPQPVDDFLLFFGSSGAGSTSAPLCNECRRFWKTGHYEDSKPTLI